MRQISARSSGSSLLAQAQAASAFLHRRFVQFCQVGGQVMVPARSYLGTEAASPWSKLRREQARAVWGKLHLQNTRVHPSITGMSQTSIISDTMTVSICLPWSTGLSTHLLTDKWTGQSTGHLWQRGRGSAAATSVRLCKHSQTWCNRAQQWWWNRPSMCKGLVMTVA